MVGDRRRAVRHAGRAGGLLLVFFGYTHCPDICPTTLVDVRLALREPDLDAERVSVAFATVDPERDTPDVLVPFLGHFVEERSHALATTDEAELAAAMAAFRASAEKVPDPDGEGYEMSHTAQVFVVDETGTVLVEWPFGTYPESMAHDLRVLLARQADDA
ncbi:MAG: SCO family protein [Acidimicrobiia bacterium]|nr:SCO family protein [Acidimicrobiia bacterium]